MLSFPFDIKQPLLIPSQSNIPWPELWYRLWFPFVIRSSISVLTTKQKDNYDPKSEFTFSTTNWPWFVQHQAEPYKSKMISTSITQKLPVDHEFQPIVLKPWSVRHQNSMPNTFWNWTPNQSWFRHSYPTFNLLQTISTSNSTNKPIEVEFDFFWNWHFDVKD